MLPTGAASRLSAGTRRTALLLLVAALVVGGAAASAASRAAARWPDVEPAATTLLEPLDGTDARARPGSPGDAVVALENADGAVTISLPRHPGERFAGLGERFGTPGLDGVLEGRLLSSRPTDGTGAANGTSYSPAPFLLSSRGYGLQLDTLAAATFDLREPGRVTIRVEAGRVLAHVITAPDPAGVLARRSALVGRPPIPPSWGLGVWKSLIGGPTRVMADLATLTGAGVPLDAVWTYDLLDPDSGFGWWWPIYRPVAIGAYPDARAMVAALHARGVRVLGYLSPFLVPGRPGFDEAAGRGFLVRDAAGGVHLEPWWGTSGWRAYVDFTNPAATAWWQSRVSHAVAATGFDGAMQDYAEDAPLDGRYANGMTGVEVRALYPVLYARSAHVAAERARPGATVLFARSGYDGTQEITTGHFTGDQTRDWDPLTGLPSVPAGMLSGSVSGWPYWGPDIGGFLTGSGEHDRELWARWVEVGALSPVMRDMLGAQHDPVGVLTDAGTLSLFGAYARLHAGLGPYLGDLAVEAHRTGLPLLRPLWLVDPDDPTAWVADDQYLLGRDLLVAPVLRRGVTEQAVYLPAGRWRSYWTGEVFGGRRWVHVAAPVERIPLFVRDGARVGLPPAGSLGLPPGIATG
ncbi:alpha-xylosidase [Actinomycetospora sp. NBRC 106375]|uniref:TIM-barrel domain-containing protein n=1 Tax=Actinomycetospora sp. NBRC 106375 TaxID=3032207 RepID=UPI0024A60776|nr:TIM-barrel domain-containing protein [Actinomycetospora sp. NBRC 106375]GLZ44249.1 alpha-xylosidase [Actinomycetospora sp. NBRC 106375]